MDSKEMLVVKSLQNRMGKRVCLTRGCVHLQLVASVVLFRRLFKVLCCCFISCLETGSHYVTLAVLELTVD